MTAKEVLLQLARKDARIEGMRERLQRYRELAEGQRARLHSLPGGGQRRTSSVEEYVSKIVDLTRDLDAQIDETTVAFSSNSEPVFESGEAEGELMIECPEVNLNNIRVTIARDDTGEQVYDSGILQPNSYIYSDSLQTKKPLPAGSYACTATVHLLDRDTDKEKGIAQAALVITIER